MDKSVLKAWLEAGYMEDKNLFETKEGTPQGGIASPTLANMALDGLEETVKVIGKQRDKINFVRYADDWIITGSSRELLEEKVLPVVSAFLKERGLELSPEKTKITHIDEGFDFLGFNIRKYKGKLLIKPGDKGIKAFTAKIGEIIDSSLGAKTEDLINRLNPIIRGWAEHNKRVVAKETFSKVDHTIFQKVWNWTKRRHSNKSMRWIKEKYFIKIRNRDWVFFSREKDKKSGNKKIVTLIRATNTQITRHIKILSKANPYDPGYSEYFQQRSYKQRRRATGSSNNDLRKA
jgi:RNA-directed DNA polymerase